MARHHHGGDELAQRVALALTVCPSREQKKAAALYTQAGDYQKTARFYYQKAEDTYYQANNWAAYDDWRRARDQWDYFYSRSDPVAESFCFSTLSRNVFDLTRLFSSSQEPLNGSLGYEGLFPLHTCSLMWPPRRLASSCGHVLYVFSYEGVCTTKILRQDSFFSHTHARTRRTTHRHRDIHAMAKTCQKAIAHSIWKKVWRC